MLTHLSLKDFVIVRELNLDVQSGLTVLTGETGAGKSILIDALEMILGARTDVGVIREGAQATDLTAIFEVNNDVARYLADAALAADDLLDRSVIIRRMIDQNGRSRAWVNGIPVTLTQVRALGEQLLDVHGQHAHQSLLKPASQLALLDTYGHYPEELSAVRESYHAWKKASDALQEAKNNAQKLADEAERLSWVHEELSAIDPKEGEWETINAEHKRLVNAHDIIDGLRDAIETLDAGDRSVVSALGREAAHIDHLSQYDERLAGYAQQLYEAQAVAEDALRELERYLDRTDLDESRFEEIDERGSLYFNAARKFHVLPETLFEKYTETCDKLQSLEASLDLEALISAEKTAQSTYLKCARALTLKRQTTAKDLSAKVTAAMQTLAMTGGAFEIALTASSPTVHGVETCEFLVAGHTGVSARPLTKVASGGELSRISLAIAVITSTATPVDTLIFDEVDSGVGGAVAEVVGKLLQTLAADRQVLCVTHLPQVAVFGHHHMRVQKQQTENATESRLVALDADARIEEIARMLGGQTITDTTKANAAEMLAMAHAN
ncbi:MAG: DNA repair protein RecN [Burkholderiaceae bacterium]|nr:DNA repair protein RecN [Burkholderiaceae bacterium]